MDLPNKLSRLGLERYSAAIKAAARPCRVARVTEVRSSSFLGGLPAVEDGFQWPWKEQRPLEFLAQLTLADLGLEGSGHLLFFWDNYHWGGSARDKGHAVATLVSTGKPWSENLPSYEKKSFFGRRTEMLSLKEALTAFAVSSAFSPCTAIISVFPASEPK